MSFIVGIMVSVHHGSGDQGSIPGQVMPKTQMVLDAVLLNTAL